MAIESSKIVFGRRLREFRLVANLSQREFADFMDTGNNYISEVENGAANPSFDILIRYATFFGVEYHQMGNPDYPVPTFEQLPIATRRAIAKVKKEQAATKAADDRTKASNKEQGIPGRAKQLHALVAEGFFKKPRTGKDAFTKLNPGIPKSQLGEHTVEIGKIAVTLSSGRFLKLLDKLEPAEGSTAVRFKEKVAET